MRPKNVTKSDSSGCLVPAPMRGPDEPTDYDKAAVTLDALALEQWVRSHYRSRYVPEVVLERLGLQDLN